MAIWVVGLTGNIATGKSTAAREFERLGVPVVDADQLAREVVAPGGDALVEIVATFGKEILKADGSLNREALGDIVFGDPHALHKLNAITHPRIARLAQARIAKAEQSGAPYVLYEAALIVENKLHLGMHALVVVRTDASLQYDRLMARSGLSEQQARARISSQTPQEAKAQAATFVIDNNGNLEDLQRQVGEIHHALIRRAEEARL